MEKDALVELMDRLLTELEREVPSPALKQMQLEVHWLRTRLLADSLTLPDWQLLILKPSPDLLQMTRVDVARKELVESIYKYMNK